MQNLHYPTPPNSKMQHSQANCSIHRHTTQNKPQKLKKTSLTKAFSTPKTKKNHETFKFFSILLAWYIFLIYLCTIKQEETTFLLKNKPWRGGRVVDCTGLENRRTERYRGFESLSLRKKRFNKLKINKLSRFFN